MDALLFMCLCVCVCVMCIMHCPIRSYNGAPILDVINIFGPESLEVCFDEILRMVFLYPVSMCLSEE